MEPDLSELTNLLHQEGFLHSGGDSFHPKARLRVHPLVVNELMKHYIIDGLRTWRDEDMSKFMGLTVTVDATMEPGTWQFIAGEGKIT